MINLIRSDLYKIRKSKAFLICTILCVLFAILGPVMLNYSRDMIKSIPPEVMNNPNMQATMNMDSGLHVGVGSYEMILSDESMTGISYITQLFSGNTFELFLAIAISIFITAEFAAGTIKNTVSKGFSRIHIYLSKVMVASVAMLVMFAIYTVVGIISGSVVFGIGECNTQIILQILGLFGLQILLHIGLTSLFVMVGMSIRNNAGTIATNLLAMMLVGTILAGVSMLIGNKVQLDQYWIASLISSVNQLDIPFTDAFKSIVVSLAYSFITIGIGITIFRKQDIK